MTPRLDALAAGGVRFEVGISPTPLTLPAHTTLMTGLDPPHHGVRHNAMFRFDGRAPTLAERFQEAEIATAAFVSAYVLDRTFGLARGFETYDDHMNARGPVVGANLVAERSGADTVDAALRWLDDAPDRFLLWVHLYDPHAPYGAPAPFRARFRGDPYAGEVAHADAQLGRLLDRIEERWPDAGTLTVVTSDHGEALGDHGEPTHSFGLYEATQHVPLLVAGPDLPIGRVVSEPVGLVDVAPTVLELLGLPGLETQHGRSLVADLRGDPDAARSAESGETVFYLETLATQLDMGWSALLGVRTPRYKYIRAPRPELYDLARDPGETRDLAAEQPELAARLDALIDARMAGAPETRRNLTLDPAQRARLESLGYAAPVADPNGADFGRVGGLDPKDELPTLAAYNEANRLVDLGEVEEALALLVASGGHGYDWLTLRGQAAGRAGRFDMAREAAEAALPLAPSRPVAHAILGSVHEGEGRLDEAEAAYRRASELAPGVGSYRALLGKLEEMRGNLDEARRLYREAAGARVPAAPGIWREAALDLEAGRIEQAGRLLAQVPGHHLRREEAAYRLARAELLAGRIEMGLVRVDAGLRERPDSFLLLRVKGALLDQAGRPEQALVVHERAAALRPDDPAVANDLAWTLTILERDLDRALALAERAHRQLGPIGEILDTLAAIHAARGHPELALPLVEQGLESAQGDLRAALLLRQAELLHGQQRPEEARASLRAARAMDRPSIHGWQGRVWVLAGKLGEPRNSRN